MRSCLQFVSLLLYVHTLIDLATSLELENLVLGETEVLESTVNLTLVGRRDLATGDGLVERRRTADEDLDVVGVGSGRVALDELLGDETALTLPVGGGLVEEVVHVKLLGLGLGDGVDLVLEQNVALGGVTVEKVDLGLVLGVLVDGLDELVQRGDTGSGTNQGDLLVEVGLPLVLDDGTLEGQGLALLELVDVLGHLSLGVRLDDELKLALLVGVGNGGVRSHHVGALGGHVLGEQSGGGGQAQGGVGGGELEDERLGVVGQVLGGLELEVDPLVIALEGGGLGVVGDGHVGKVVGGGGGGDYGGGSNGGPGLC